MPGSVLAVLKEMGNPNLQGVRVLFVEDDPDSREMLIELASFLGATAAGAADAAEAIVCVEEFRPNVAIVDIGLPGDDGCEVARVLRARSLGGQIRLIALTGSSDETTRKAAVEAGFDSFIVKPLKPDSLPEILKPSPHSA